MAVFDAVLVVELPTISEKEMITASLDLVHMGATPLMLGRGISLLAQSATDVNAFRRLWDAIKKHPGIATDISRSSAAGTQVADEVLPEPIRAMKIACDAKDKNLLIAAVGWWNVIRHAQQGVTPVVLHTRLSDGRVARAQQELSTEWKLK